MLILLFVQNYFKLGIWYIQYIVFLVEIPSSSLSLTFIYMLSCWMGMIMYRNISFKKDSREENSFEQS